MIAPTHPQDLLEILFGPADPVAEFRFHVAIDDMYTGSFTECSGISMKRDVREVREGGRNNYVHKLAGPVSHSSITFRKGIMFANTLWEWFEEGMDDCKVELKDLTIWQYSSYFNVPPRWYNIEDAFPESWEISAMRTDGTSFSVESLTIAFRKMEVESLPTAAVLALQAIGAVL